MYSILLQFTEPYVSTHSQDFLIYSRNDSIETFQFINMLEPNPIHVTIHTLINNNFSCICNFSSRDTVHMEAMMQGKLNKMHHIRELKYTVQAARHKQLRCQFRSAKISRTAREDNANPSPSNAHPLAGC